MRKCGIYEILNKITLWKYVGSSADLSKRIDSHIDKLVAGVHPNIHLQRAWNKYGATNFSFRVLEYCSKEELLVREQSYLPEEKTFEALQKNKFYNRNPIAGSRAGTKDTEETRAKVSERLKGNKYAAGKKMPDHVREKLLAVNKGRKMTAENKAKLSGPRSKEWVEKVAQANRGKKRKPFTEEHKQKLSKAAKGNKHLQGHHPSEETKRKISESLKKRNKGSL